MTTQAMPSAGRHAGDAVRAAPTVHTHTSGAYRAGILAGTIAGAVMAVFMMAWMTVVGHSVWTNPDLIAAMWLGPHVADGRLGGATLVGFATHMATSALMGLVAVPFVAGLSRGRTLLASLSYAVASYPVVFALVLSWANPLMVARTELVPMTVAHAVFGLTMGAAFLGLTHGARSDPGSRS